ncbi:hypothetical protein CfE428DRAFT_2460 [Chthoniobacter flavus Ellin428]|uniref:Uncharacterized protein n=1 Tax=Chthoniobacter flavus Ellin428 TaxID=497964 RepID=B4D0K9_9BACT|nr:hypothetical protein CfE428DRAFT_2460 [Chthoniobacter flavus Ellin428]TCO91858.1 hypothetical protein EV701_107139 [Chthoniobacter flavus]
MSVAGQRVGQSFLLHNDEGDAVRKRPSLVGAGIVKLQTSTKILRRNGNDPRRRVLGERVKSFSKPTPGMRFRKGICHFREHPLSGHYLTFESIYPSPHTAMVAIASIDERNIEKRVGKYSHGFLAWP